MRKFDSERGAWNKAEEYRKLLVVVFGDMESETYGYTQKQYRQATIIGKTQAIVSPKRWIIPI